MSFLTDSQKAKITAAVAPLYQDPEFANVADFLIDATEMVPPVPPVAETDSVEVPPAPTPTV